MRKKGLVILLGGTLLGFGAGRAARAADTSATGSSETAATIQRRLAHDPELKDNLVRVTVIGDTATLKGTVDSEEEKARAARLAMVGPVSSVDNQLKVASTGATATVTDASLTTQIKAKMLAEWGLHAKDIHVDTNNGVVTLTGVVSDELMRQRAVEMARNNSGVKRIDDQLRVQSEPQENLK